MLLTSNGGGGVRPPLVPQLRPIKGAPFAPRKHNSISKTPTNFIQLDQINFPLSESIQMADHRRLITATLALLAATSISAVPFMSSSASASSSSQRHPNVDLGTMLSMGGGRVMAAEDLPPGKSWIRGQPSGSRKSDPDPFLSRI